MSSYVYKYVLNDEIIYIGKTSGPIDRRLKAHGKPGDNIAEDGWNEINGSDIYIAECANPSMADTIESMLINKYHPKYNKAKTNKWDGIPFIEPVWKIYRYLNNSEINSEILQLKNKIQTLENSNEFLKTENERLKKYIDQLEKRKAAIIEKPIVTDSCSDCKCNKFYLDCESYMKSFAENYLQYEWMVDNF